MTRRLILSLAIVALASGCARVGSSRLNPMNWFSRSQAVAPVVSVSAADDPRPMMDQVADVVVTPTAGGAIIRARGLAPRQGYYDGALVTVPAEPGVLAYEFRIVPPPQPTRVSAPRSREIDVAVFVNDRTLASVGEIRVSAARNARALRR